MRHPGGKPLTDSLWQKLVATEVDLSQTRFNLEGLMAETRGWYHVAHTWSFVSMAMVVRAQDAARAERKQLFYIPALDAPKKFCTEGLYKEMMQEFNLRVTKKIPGVALLYVGMKVRFTTSIQAPFLVQDSTGTVVGMELSPGDSERAEQFPQELVLYELPVCVYVKLDDSECIFLPCCSKISPICADCSNMKGVFAVKPVQRLWEFRSETGFPIMPECVSPLYSVQGTTADPGMVMRWMLPKRLSSEIRWLIVYVALSRVRALRQLKSIGLSADIRSVIEEGPPQNLLRSFDQMLGTKVDKTFAKAIEYRKLLGWPEEVSNPAQ